MKFIFMSMFKLNAGTSSDIQVFRLVDLIRWIKEHPEIGIERKEAKLLWCGAYDGKYLEQNKAKFDNDIWKL
jgi:hypothetical protein